MAPHRPARGAVRLLAPALGPALAGVLLVACAGGGAGDRDSDAGPDAVSGGRSGRSEPAASDLDEALPHLEDLLAEHDRLVAEVLADPSVADDPDDPLVRQYMALFAPDSNLPDQVIEVWAREAADGVTVEPYDDEHPVVETRIDGDIEVVDDDEVRIPTCEASRERIYVDGELTEGIPQREQSGLTIAVRVDGQWRISTREAHTDQTCGTATGGQ